MSTSAAEADLSVFLYGTDSVAANGFAEVDVVVTNNGPADAERVRTLVALPPGLIAVDHYGPIVARTASGTTYRFDESSPLPSGQSRTYALLVETTRRQPTNGHVTAITRSRTADPASQNNTATRPLPAAGGRPNY